MNSYILYKLTVGNPKSTLEYIKDVHDSLASESTNSQDPVQQPSATIKLTQLPGRKERECVVASDQKNNTRRSSSCQKGVHALCFQNIVLVTSFFAFIYLYTLFSG